MWVKINENITEKDCLYKDKAGEIYQVAKTPIWDENGQIFYVVGGNSSFTIDFRHATPVSIRKEKLGKIKDRMKE